jgi:hypothetical protein
MRDLRTTIDAGNRFYQAVMAADEQKREHSKSEIEVFITAFATAFARDAELRFRPNILFCNVHALMKLPAHRQLCLVQIDGAGCGLSFHQDLLASDDGNGGLIFVAKSWPLLVVLGAALARGLDFSGSFVFEIGDNGTLDSVSFCSNNQSACLILDFEFLRHAGYREFREDYARHRVAWIDRGDKVFWRGASSGRRLHEPPARGEADDLSWLQRLRLCVAAKDPAVAERCDIGLSQIVQAPEPHLRDSILDAGLVKGFVPRAQFVRQKFVVDIDGNSNAWSGLFLALYGGSCVLKVGSCEGYRQWYYDSLQPWRNYVPIQKDLSDFPEKVDWVRRNDRKAEQIAKRGQELAERITLENAIDVSARNLKAWLMRKCVASSSHSALA